MKGSSIGGMLTEKLPGNSISKFCLILVEGFYQINELRKVY